LTGATSATVANDFTSSCYTVNNHNYCFYTNGSVMSWNEARQFCAGMNSTLPIIRDEDIDKVFQKFIVNDSYNVIQNNYVWIGALARSSYRGLGSWHWINGRPAGRSDKPALENYVFVIKAYAKILFYIHQINQKKCLELLHTKLYQRFDEETSQIKSTTI